MCKLRRKAKEDARYAREDAFLTGIFSSHKTETFGYQGTGKDLLASHAIRLIGRPYYANIQYDGNATLFDLKDLNAGGNTYQDLINGTVRKFPRKFAEGRHKYISDCGIYLPSQSTPATSETCSFSMRKNSKNTNPFGYTTNGGYAAQYGVRLRFPRSCIQDTLPSEMLAFLVLLASAPLLSKSNLLWRIKK